jgi:glycosyltransferase involved in cell wall biosynthesis
MNKSKLKILMVSEASFLSSGFAIYTREILSRLYKTNKYEIAEFASYGLVNDPRDKSIPWKYYANAVKDDDPRHKEYSSRGDNQFGRWRFEKVLLDFRPDVVIDIRDYWMSSYQAISPLRKFFHWILMPTVDSAPQQEEWIDTFLSADSVFTYSDWGAEVLKNQSSGKINYIGTVSPGVDLSTFTPIEDNKALREQYGVPPNSFVVGSVMRNQKRKLIPELMVSFRKAIDTLKQEGNVIGEKIYLYLHTSYPDAGWDLPELLKEHRLANRVLFTYLCRRCNHIESSVFVGPQKVCPRCLEKSMTFSSVTNGVSTEQLAKIYNLFDIYVQYSICEGFGCPQTEAGACGLPVFTVNYSAMCDIVQKLEAVPIQPSSYFKELETKAIRVYPDNNQLANEIVKISNMPISERLAKGQKTRQLTEKYYNWDDIAKKWEKHLDQIDNTYRSDWNISPIKLDKIERGLVVEPQSHFESTARLCSEHINNINMVSSMNILSLLQYSDYGFSMQGTNINRHDYNDIIAYINTYIDNINQSESVRSEKIKFNDDFIEYASIKANT